jgi:site-specific DNA recombinase
LHVQALAQDLDRRGIRTKQRQFANGRITGGGTFGVGGLAHLLRNRFYIGEVVYRGEAFRGDHDPILDPALFAAVQAKLSSQAVERRCRIRGAQALLTGRLFDEQGRRMTPTHTNKKGVRYSRRRWLKPGSRSTEIAIDSVAPSIALDRCSQLG